MKKQISIGKTLLICIICVAITFVATLSISTVVSKSNREGASTLINKLAELEKLVDQNFVGTVSHAVKHHVPPLALQPAPQIGVERLHREKFSFLQKSG